MKRYKVIKLPLSNVVTMADRLNESSIDGWELLQMFQSGQDVVAVLVMIVSKTPGTKRVIDVNSNPMDLLSNITQ